MQIIQGKNFHCFNTEVGHVTSFSLQIKLSSVQLARKYMKRVASELDTMSGPEKEPNREFLVLQGVRFAFRVHQFAGGFDAESMKAFEELRSRVRSQMGEENKMEGS